ncbi:alpha/beta hydrolase [Flavihumibacter sp. R14]|nr:alpha/beta hydrolase [Flavihumibacter soli]
MNSKAVLTSKLLTITLLAGMAIPMHLVSLHAETRPGYSISIDSVSGKQIDEKSFVMINGIEQWVTIKGDRSKPVILFLHGGPGSPLSPYADAVYKGWEKDFVLVQWDQRGAGRTFGLTAPAELDPKYLKANPLTVEQMTKDGIALTEYLLKHLGKEKVFLFGTSWGSVLAARMASSQPDFFHAYVGHSQVVKPGEWTQLYIKIFTMAEIAGDQESLELLKSIGAPPYDVANKTGKLLRVVKKYERQNSKPAPAEWFEPALEYNNETDIKHRADGDDYSFVNFSGDTRFGLKSMVAGMDLSREAVIFQIPVYFIQGARDILTPQESTREYFEKIRAPKKEYILLTETAHGFNQLVVDTKYRILMELAAGMK